MGAVKDALVFTAVLGGMAAVGYIMLSPTSAPAPRTPKPPEPKYVRPGPGWYVIMYDHVTPRKPRGRTKDYLGPFASSQAAMRAFDSSGQRHWWETEETRWEIAHRKRGPL